LAILDGHNQQVQGAQYQALILVTNSTTAVERCSLIINAKCGEEISAPYHSKKDLEENFQGFHKFSKFKILVVCGKLLEGYDNSNITVVGIVRNVSSKVVFSQFVGRCLRNSNDAVPIQAAIVAHRSNNQEKNYTNLNRLAESDPLEDDDDTNEVRSDENSNTCLVFFF